MFKFEELILSFLMHILTLLINIHKYANEEIFSNDHILVPLDLKFNLTPFEMPLHEQQQRYE